MKLKILIRNKHRFSALLFILFLFSISSGQEIEKRSFDEEKMELYAEQQDFAYMNYTVKPPSIWERLSWWFQSVLQRIFLNPNTPWITQLAYYLILILVLGLAIFYIIRLRYGGGLAVDYKPFHQGVSGIENTSVEDFDKLINGALADQNFKLAIRYIYLKSLAVLANKELIRLKDWKSPYDYSNELKGEVAISYQELARLFEFVWYGEFHAGDEEYQRGDVLLHKLEKAS